MNENRWTKPAELCQECTPVIDDDHSAWLYCVLSPDHDPPHWDETQQLWWHQPPSRAEETGTS